MVATAFAIQAKIDLEDFRGLKITKIRNSFEPGIFLMFWSKNLELGA